MMATKRFTTKYLPWLAGLLLCLAATGLAQGLPAANDFDFQLVPVLDKLPADEESETTLVASLSTKDGAPINREEIRFIVREGLGFLESSNRVAVVAKPMGNGLYTARFRAGNVDGPVKVAALWISSPTSPLPEVTTTIELVAARQLTVEVDDTHLVTGNGEQATIIAYVLDGLERPVAEADVSFQLIEGSGQLRIVDDDAVNGRYAAVFRPGQTPGRVVIEVALRGVPEMLRKRVTLGVLEVAELEAFAFPTTVVNRDIGTVTRPENAATILVSARNSDGELVRGLDPKNLLANVISGPGEVSQAHEIELASGRGSGVYAFTFTAAAVRGNSTIRILPLEDPSTTTSVSIRTVTELGQGEMVSFNMASFADNPCFPGPEEEVLITAMAADRHGSAVTDLEPEFRIVRGQGRLTSGGELKNPSGRYPTGIYLTTLETMVGGGNSITEIRALTTTSRGNLRSQSLDLYLSAVEEPRVVVFPSWIPSDEETAAVIDVFHFDTRSTATRTRRYQVKLQTGPGGAFESPNNQGVFPDLVAGDKVSSAVFHRSGGFTDQQVIDLSVIDLDAPGYPLSSASFIIGQEVELTAKASPELADRGETVEIIAFAKDEFSLAAVGHELVLTIESGNARLLGGGKMIDDGGQIAGLEDPYADDGMYVGAIEVLGAINTPVRVRITDTTPPSQPTAGVWINTGTSLVH
jgi:adhesin/invasin